MEEGVEGEVETEREKEGCSGGAPAGGEVRMKNLW